MKMLRPLLAILLAAFTLTGAAHAADAKPLRVLVTYGGHAFNTNAFFGMWDKFPGVTYA